MRWGNTMVIYTFNKDDHRYFVHDAEGDYIDREGQRWCETCNYCRGDGHEGQEICNRCNGSGKKPSKNPSLNDPFDSSMPKLIDR